MTIFGFLRGWLLGSFVTTLIGVSLQTQNVIARLNDIGADIGIGQRVSMTVYDIIHLGSVYLIFVSVGTLIAYSLGLWVYRLAGFGRSIVFAVAGGTTLLVMLLLIKEVYFGVHILAGARDGLGILMQMTAGAFGGLVFAWLTAPKTTGIRPAV